MNKTFSKVNDSALKSGLLQFNPLLASELKHASDTFTFLAKNASEFDAGDDDDLGSPEHGTEGSRTPPGSKSVLV